MSTTNSEKNDLPPDFAGFKFNNRYARLPEQFYARVNPTPVQAPGIIKVNHELAKELGLDPSLLESPDGIAMLAGNKMPADAEPLAQAYAGHQFGYLSPQLGDGRAILLGEVMDSEGKLRDIQLKGSGPTPFSRNGDGRAAVGPVIREYIVSEAMHALGIKTTRALAAVTTGEPVYREAPLPGAILTRVAASHVRIGTFEYFRNLGDKDAIKQLADFVIDRHYSPIKDPSVKDAANPYVTLLDSVIDAQASLVASWMHVGFIHGVMNTDNMSVSGETIDFGPCAFIDSYDPATVFSSIDRRGRYAYGNQGSIALWNLSRFAECLLHLFDSDVEKSIALAEERLKIFPTIFERYWLAGMQRKIGLLTDYVGDQAIVESLLELMQKNQVDFTQCFRQLADYLDVENLQTQDSQSPQPFTGLFESDEQPLQDWLARWEARLKKETLPEDELIQAMRATNPIYIPRNHHVEAVIRSAVEQADYAPMHEMVQVLTNPFAAQPGMDRYAEPPVPGGGVYQTFCGT